jgi:hypothetical protein
MAGMTIATDATNGFAINRNALEGRSRLGRRLCR